MASGRWEKFVYLAVFIAILGSAVFFVAFLAENRLGALSVRSAEVSSFKIAGIIPVRHVGFALTVAGNLILILFLFMLVGKGREMEELPLQEKEWSGELVSGFRFTFVLLSIIGLLSTLFLAGLLFVRPSNLFPWLVGLCSPWVIRLILYPVQGQLPLGDLGRILKALVVVLWGLLLLQVLISLASIFPPPLSNLVLGGLLTGLGVVGLLTLHW